MAKSLIYVLLPKGTNDIDNAVGEMMGPYDEAIQVDEYETPCSCKPLRSLDIAKELAELGPEDRCMFDERMTRLSGSVDNDMVWAEFLVNTTAFIESLPGRWSLADTPDADCVFCKGTGIRITTYNPDSKWDWWDTNPWSSGVLKDSLKSPNVPQYERDIAFIAQLDLQSLPIPDGIITPDGIWHEGCVRGTFALPMKGYGHWSEKAKQILEQNPDTIIVAVVCHNTDG